MNIVAKNRKSLQHAPTASFTMKRGEFKQMEDVRLVSHFANWLGKVSNREVKEETFEQDLMDGVALCTVLSKLQGSGLTKFHELKGNHLDTFKSKENMVSFTLGCKNLSLPVTFGTEDLEKGNIGRIASTLVFLAHTAHSQGVTVQEMDQEILDKVEQMDAALNNVEIETKEEEVTVTPQELSWWQALLVKFGLGDWISSLNVEALKAYIATLKKNVEDKVENQRVLVRQKSGEFQEKLLQKSDSWKAYLPEVIKSRIPLGGTSAPAEISAPPVETVSEEAAPSTE